MEKDVARLKNLASLILQTKGQQEMQLPCISTSGQTCERREKYSLSADDLN